MKYIQLILVILAAIFFSLVVPGLIVFASIQVGGLFGVLILEPLGWMMYLVMPVISIISIGAWWQTKK